MTKPPVKLIANVCVNLPAQHLLVEEWSIFIQKKTFVPTPMSFAAQ